ncbi:MAG TPA: hypothetical protein VGR87_05780 [Candidatus Limnocylindria bacterium]|jgi:hypothetical protein|nr:hypothetical protein [Candidatus Limnocylindria bacterium]
MLATTLAVLATASVASADVVDSGHTVTSNVVTNPCDPGDGDILLTTDTRWVIRLQPDGTVVGHFHNHSVGVSANGTKYIANRQATTTAPAGSTVVEVEVEIRRISAGSGPNAVITVTGTVPGSLNTTIRCVG